MAAKISRMFPGKPRKFLKDTVTGNKSNKSSIKSNDVKVTKVSEKNNAAYASYDDDFPHFCNGSPNQVVKNPNHSFHNNIIMHASDSIETISSKVS